MKKQGHPLVKALVFAGATVLAVLGTLSEFLIDSDSPVLGDIGVRLVCFLSAGLLYVLWLLSCLMTILDSKRKIREAPDDGAENGEPRHPGAR